MKFIITTFFILLFTLTAFSQNNGEVVEMVKAVSYFNGIEGSLDCIIRKYPDLQSNALGQKAKLNKWHKNSVDFLRSKLHEKLAGEYEKFELQLSQAINCDLITHQSSLDYLSNLFNDRIQGNNETYSEFVQLLLKYNPKYNNNNLKEFMDEFRTRYSTKDHPKSKGLDYSISFPKSWIVKDGSRPNIIIKAVDQRNSSLYLMLMTKEFMNKNELEKLISEEGLDIKSNIYKDWISDAIFTPEFISNSIEDASEFKEPVKTKLDGQPAILYYTKTPNERAGIKIEVHQNLAIVIYRNYLIFITLGAGGIENESTFDYSKLENGNIEMLFKSILNTLVIDEQWK